MHILILPSEEFIPDYEPDAGIFQYHQAKVLVSAGHNVGVLSIKQTFTIPMILKAMLFKLFNKKAGNKSDYYSFTGLADLMYNKMFNLKHFYSQESIEGINVYRMDGFYYLNTKDSQRLNGWLQAGLTLFEEYMKKFGTPEIIHAHNAMFGGMLAYQIYKKYGLPYIITEHSSRWALQEIRSPLLKRRAKDAYLNSKYAFAVSSDFSNKLNAGFNINKFTVLPNVIDPYLEYKQIELSNSLNGKFIFFHAGHFKPVKDQVTLLKAFKIIVEKSSVPVELRMAGKGDLEIELKKLSSTLGIQEHINFLGFLNREGLDHEMRKCNCFVMSSLYETFCVVLIEAMLYGKPVIATNSGGPADIVNPACGLLVNHKNPELLADAMLKMLNSYKEYSPEAIRKYVINKFGTSSFLQSAVNTYSKAIA